MKTNNVMTAMSVAKRQVEPRDRALIRSTKACKIKQPEIETRLHVFTIRHINIPMKKRGNSNRMVAAREAEQLRLVEPQFGLL
ncbi:hypothetical protein GOB36_30180 [Sinorhizobium meliloti]|uniref:hypothetical protein n=1 Tax=Rhizobium meliloti TaxID=382 RepID=UPI00299CFC24|nr:hypothetical protein [Sinorhizobium meliloti]MDX0036334.1 hypothetical protein [Sinorhizobium meliloti]